MFEKKSNKTINDEIDTMIIHRIQQIPYPIRCTITKVYDDNKHVDITSESGDLKYVETIGNNLAVNNTGILIFLNGSSDDYIIITK